MNVKREDLFDKNQTGAEMKRLVNSYSNDLKNIYITFEGKQTALADLPVEYFFSIVKDIKYKIDSKPVELLMRPYYAMKFRKNGLDCKKKSILMASFAKANNIPYRFIASSIRKDKRKHHVFPQLFINEQWVNFDCTYNNYYIGQEKELTAAEVL